VNNYPIQPLPQEQTQNRVALDGIGEIAEIGVEAAARGIGQAVAGDGQAVGQAADVICDAAGGLADASGEIIDGAAEVLLEGAAEAGSSLICGILEFIAGIFDGL